VSATGYTDIFEDAMGELLLVFNAENEVIER
jgi:hypothetical protein